VKPKFEVHAVAACAENMPDGNAYRPGDIWGSLEGKTVEIINTDAEGRLVLADALAYARTLSPDVIVDNATLTGACVVALGNTCSGWYANDEEVAARATWPTSSKRETGMGGRSRRRCSCASSLATFDGSIATSQAHHPSIDRSRGCRAKGPRATECSPSSP
jgi:Cytosol aminopeptidase family, catalytic domain